MAGFTGMGDLSALTTMMEEAEEAAQRRGMSSDDPAVRSKTNIVTGANSRRGGAAASSTTLTTTDEAAPTNDGTSGAAAKQPRVKDPDAIWDELDDEEAVDPDFEDDGREVPEYDIHYKQNVGSEDVFLGMSGKTPLTSDCKFMVLRIKLPGAKLKDIDLTVEKQKIIVQDPTYRLCTYLPYPAEDKKGRAQWIAEKEVLSVTLPILRAEW